MPEISRIIDQLSRCFDGPAWSGDSVMEILKGVTASQAAARPIANAHTIWEIVRHMTVWHDVAERRINGVKFQPTDEQDWPQGDISETAWQATLDDLRRANRELKEAVSRLTDDELDLVPEGFQTPAYVLLHGVIQHNLYHAGQIALLKKFAK